MWSFFVFLILDRRYQNQYGCSISLPVTGFSFLLFTRFRKERWLIIFVVKPALPKNIYRCLSFGFTFWFDWVHRWTGLLSYLHGGSILTNSPVRYKIYKWWRITSLNKMTKNDIYDSQKRYRCFMTKLDRLLTPLPESDQRIIRGKPKYFCRNAQNLAYFRALDRIFGFRDTSYIRRLRLFNVLKLICYATDKK